MYELMTGVFPFEGESMPDLIAAHLFRPPKDFSESDPEGRIPPEVRQAISHSLEKDPDKRIESAEEFLALLADGSPSETLAEDLGPNTQHHHQPSRGGAGRGGGINTGRLDDQFGPDPTNPPRTTPAARGLALVPDDAEAVATLLEEVDGLVSEGKHGVARRLLYRVLAAEPDHEGARGTLADVENALREAAERAEREAEAAQQRAGAIAEIAQSIEEDLRTESIAAAEEKLRGAISDLGDATRFDELDAKVIRLNLELQERARDQAIDRAHREINEHLLAERLEEARACLEQALSELGRDERLERASAAADRLDMRLEERKREQEIAETARRIEAALVAQDIESAEEMLTKAEARFEKDSRILSLAQRLSELRAEIEESARRAAIAAVVSSVEACLEGEEVGEAEDLLRAGRSEHGDEADFETLAQRISELRSTLESRAHEVAVQARVAQVEASLAGDRVDEADSGLTSALEELGEDARFMYLERKLEALRVRLREAAGKKQSQHWWPRCRGTWRPRR